MSFGINNQNKTQIEDRIIPPNKDIVPVFTKGRPQILRVTSMLQLNEIRARNKDKMMVILFWAIWYPECEEMRKECERIAPSLQNLKICWCDVDKDKEIIDEYEVYKVPYILLSHPHKEDLEFIKNPRTNQIHKIFQAYDEYYQRLFKNEKKKAYSEIQNKISQFPIVVFMRGDQMNPKCKSSKILSDCFKKMEITFLDFDILKDDNLKEWLKFYSNWPSFPQVYISQKFIGGTEIVLQLAENDEFMQLVPQECIKANALDKMNAEINRSIVVVFLKGTPNNPSDGYQAKAIEYLNQTKVKYSWFNVMTDSDVREMLKDYSRWNSFPQLFINGKFVGGLNFIVDNVKSGKFSNFVPTTEILLPLRDKIYKLMNKGVYMIFMRGHPQYPTCQNSKKMMDIFHKHYPWVIQNKKNPELNLEYFDVSKEKEIEESLLRFTKFNEIPQFHCDGKLIGGVEIIEELHEAGVLLNILLKEGERINPNEVQKQQKNKNSNISNSFC